jgi:hypothetical protein
MTAGSLAGSKMETLLAELATYPQTLNDLYDALLNAGNAFEQGKLRSSFSGSHLPRDT